MRVALAWAKALVPRPPVEVVAPGDGGAAFDGGAGD
jgi:hypothetical protein